MLTAKRFVELRREFDKCERQIEALLRTHYSDNRYITPYGETATMFEILQLKAQIIKDFAAAERKIRGIKS